MYRITQAYYRVPGQDEFSSDILLHDESYRDSSYIMERSAGGNPKDRYGNELSGAWLYHVIIIGITEKVINDLRAQWGNNQHLHWQLEIDQKEIWQTRVGVLSEVRSDGSVVFRIPKDYVARKDALEK